MTPFSTWLQQALGGTAGVAFISAVAALFVAAITAISALLVAIITQFLTRRREDRTKRIQLTIEQAEKQLNEFYSPLLSLAMQLDQTAEGSDFVVPKAPDDVRSKIDKIMWDDIYSPIHEKIISILNTKIHLIDGFNIEKGLGFKDYLLHYESQRIYWVLVDKGYTIPDVDFPPYPALFNVDIRAGLSTVTKRYEDGHFYQRAIAGGIEGFRRSLAANFRLV